MSTQSFQSQPSTHLKDFKQQMQKLKSPYIQNINKTKQSFKNTLKNFETQLKVSLISKKNLYDYQTEHPSQIQKRSLNQLDTQQNEKQNIQQSFKDIGQNGSIKLNSKKINSLQLKQWKYNEKYSFANIQDVKENFINVFNKKLSLKKKQKENKKKCYDFKEDQKNMLKQIYAELSQYENKKFIQIDKVVKFFEQNQLFYLFYNIHPNRLKHILKEFGRTKKNNLTQVQFLHFFFMDRPLLLDLSDPNEKIVQRRCILDDENWKQLKKVFNTLDTFGNQTIHIKPFFQKLKSWLLNPHLIYSPVIQFPEIGRVYTLKKIIFDLQNKFEFNDKVEWKDIQSVITNFNHKQQPTLDIIFEGNLQKATILFDSNYFLIDKQVINILKRLFQKCPKESEFFVSTKFICNEILQSHDVRPYFKNSIREKTTIEGGYINLEEATRFMAAKAPNYIDLDQYLQYFSIKGPITNVLLSEKQKQESTSDEDEEQISKQMKMLRKVRSLQRLHQSRLAKKNKRVVMPITEFQQFNLTKKQKQTIRQRKVKQMLEQKQRQQLKQLNNKFKANPIPADLNPQRIRMQQRRLQQHKKKKLEQMSKQKQQDKQILDYLKANTRLFQHLHKDLNSDKNERNKNFEQNLSPKKTFQHKPVPWFVQEEMMEKIQREKNQRKHKLYQEAKLKYVRSWNNLPDFFYDRQQDQNQESILEQLNKNRSAHGRPAIKVNPVPNFKQLHRQFQQSLEKKKREFKPTKVQEFKLTSPKPQKTEATSLYLSPQTKQIKQNKRWRETLHSPPSNIISTTKKTQEWMKFNHKLQQQKALQKQIQIIQQKERKLKKKNFAKFMSKKLTMQEQTMPNLQAQTTQKLKRYKKNVKHLQRQTQRQLCQIYARVLQRPFLFELASQQCAPSQTSYKKGPKKANKNKNKVIKQIQPIDMSEQSNNRHNYYQQPQQQAYQNNGENYEYAEYEQSQGSPHSYGNANMNQSF